MNVYFEFGAVPLDCVGRVASWRRPRDAIKHAPMVVVMESSDTDEGTYTPASSVTVVGRDQLLALRSAIDEALKKGGEA
ncbi:hypothetical protein [Hydrogenophaga sp.]|uniref:hypothetical protein n=1 Tax=Hydrogenophaga sp. TaxID=1904254 RepID=UPI0008D15AA9|nr:hypothetical protein [Hydrogenophaga sp.]OGA78801.1 MAG: hypothetical protein A2X73_07565 [Burkholderiales bacterium GWE1_65_30]